MIPCDLRYTTPINKSFWNDNVKYIKFHRQGVDLYGASFEQINQKAKANVILLTGWSETFLKYSEIIKLLYELGFNVYTYDHQSQGISGRWLIDSQLTWVHSFDDYIDDLSYFASIIPNNHLPLYIIASSMGGLIASIAMTRFPHLFNRAILLAPMFRNKCGTKYFNYQFPLPQNIVYWFTYLACKLGLGRMHVIGFFNEKSTDKLKLNITTSDTNQLNQLEWIRHNYPNTICNCITSDWLIQSLETQMKFEDRYAFVNTNTLVICADHDYFVHNRAISIFALRANNCKVFFAPNSYHELWAENDEIRGATLKTISNFLTQESDNVNDVEPIEPLINFDPTRPMYSLAEAVIRSTGVLLATVGVIIGITMIFETKRK